MGHLTWHRILPDKHRKPGRHAVASVLVGLGQFGRVSHRISVSQLGVQKPCSVGLSPCQQGACTSLDTLETMNAPIAAIIAFMTIEHFDVLIVGAGLSGIGAAFHLQTYCPDRSYAILEGRQSIGGTWDLFRYPGVRSDSDMYTLGYSFKPWQEAKAIADGPSILKYVQETAKDNGIERHIRFRHAVKAASWSSVDAKWTVEVQVQSGQDNTAENATISCNFLFMCAGYYSYKEGFSPELPGVKDINRVTALLQSTAQLEFWETFKAQEMGSFIMAANNAKIPNLSKDDRPQMIH